MGIDEASRIKNPTAKTTKICIRWGKLAEFRRIMTGTPVPRSPLDLWAQCEFLESGCLGYRNFFTFRAKFAIMEKKMFGGREVQIVVGHRYTDQLSTTLSGIATIIRKEDCLDLPPKVFEEWEVSLTPEQTRIYTELKNFATAELQEGKFVTSTMVITTLLRMQQIVCGYARDENGDFHPIPTNRPRELLNIMEERKGEKTIVWCHFREDIELVKTALEADGFKVVTYHGGTSSDDRAEAIYRFQGERAGPGGATDYCPPDRQAEVFLGTEHAGGYGITLTASDLVVYYSNGFDLEKRLQSEDRAHRIGQTRSVTYIDMVARGTVDEKVIAALKKKEQLANIIMDGPARIRDLFG
jgi:SNF2 family DNA or RNA helicase